jgi:lysophospholipase L1-like esterase
VPSSRSASPISRSSEGRALPHPAAALAFKLALAPWLVAQGLLTRRRTPVLPEASGPREGRVGAAAGAPLRLLVAGDSSAAGVGVGHQDEAVVGHLTRTLAERFGKSVDWWLRAKSGLTTQGVHALLAAEPAPVADVAVVITGVNDVIDQVPVRRAIAHRAALADWLLTQGLASHVVFAPLPPVHRFPRLPEPLRGVLGIDARRHDEALRQWAAGRHDVSHAAIALDVGPETMASDGFHPGEPIYRACGEALARHVAGRFA